jgi:hypothetical protein
MRPPTRVLAVALLALTALLALGAAAACAAAPRPHWTIAVESMPTEFTAGSESDYYKITVRNSGDEVSHGPVTVSAALPAGVTATGIAGYASLNFESQMPCELATVTCELPEFGPQSGHVAGGSDGELLQITIRVTVGEPANPALSVVTVSGGGAPATSLDVATALSASPQLVPFGTSYFDSEATGVDGNAEIQAGSHPFAFTTGFAFHTAAIENKFEVQESRPIPNAAVRDVHVNLPPGLVGNPRAVPQCGQSEFQTGNGYHSCPPDTQVGWIHLFFYGKLVSQEFPVYNIAPPPGEPAELGFTYAGFVHLPIFFHVRTDGDYGLTADTTEINESNPLRYAILTVWGVPADPSHDSLRRGASNPGSPCYQGEGCVAGVPAKPFLSLPASCGEPLGTSLESDSWEGGVAPLASVAMPAMAGCEHLAFDPSVTVMPEATAAGAPDGVSFDVAVPQNEEPGGLATPDVHRISVVLPAGVVVSPSAANGLLGCPETGPEGINLHEATPARCPAASKLGVVEVESPALAHALHGSVFLAQQGNAGPSQGSNPFGSLMAAYVVAEGEGVIVKQAGQVTANPITGQLSVSFDEVPQLPFSDLRVRLSGGPGAALVNPTACGSFTTTTTLSPWSGGSATRSSSFTTTGCGGGFAPSFVAGSSSNQAAGFSPFSLSFARQDGEQYFAGVTQTLPRGVLGRIAGVPKCSEAELAARSCAAASRLGSVTVAAGPGPNPFNVHGSIYLTGAYRGGPFGEAVIVPAIAGPFNLGTVVVRGAIDVDPRTAQVTVVSDPFPTILEGIPLQVRSVSVLLDREGFMFNPTSCAEEATVGTIASTGGVAAAVSSRYQAAGCASLGFKPVLKASTQGATSKANGAALKVTVTSSPGQANIGKVKVSLPIQMPSRLSTLQKACVSSVFEANPAACPTASVVATVRLRTPVLASPLTGPGYLVSHGGAAFPNLVFVLQGEGVTALLEGTTDIKKGITSETFASVPDVPVGSFESTLPEGPFSALATNLPANAKRSFCGQKLTMPTSITAQNGAVIRQATKVTVTGCPKAKSARRARTSGHRNGKGGK